jgi:hypothetical protein
VPDDAAWLNDLTWPRSQVPSYIYSIPSHIQLANSPHRDEGEDRECFGSAARCQPAKTTQPGHQIDDDQKGGVAESQIRLLFVETTRPEPTRRLLRSRTSLLLDGHRTPRMPQVHAEKAVCVVSGALFPRQHGGTSAHGP